LLWEGEGLAWRTVGAVAGARVGVVDLVGAVAAEPFADGHSTHTGERHGAAEGAVGYTSLLHNHNAQAVAA